MRRRNARPIRLAPRRDSVAPLSGTVGAVTPLIRTWRRSVKPTGYEIATLSIDSPADATTVRKFWPFPRVSEKVEVNPRLSRTEIVAVPPLVPIVPPMNILKIRSPNGPVAEVMLLMSLSAT